MCLIADVDALKAALAAVQQAREISFSLRLSPALSAALTDAQLRQLLVVSLPMVQGIGSRIVRSRGRETLLTAKLRYRDGVRMLDHLRGREGELPENMTDTLRSARAVADEAMRHAAPEERFRYLYGWVCRSIAYEHTAPGHKDYDKLVGAAGVLRSGRGNCQGFADVMYLLCGLAGLEVEYRCGMGARRLHVWNAVRLGGAWQEADASRGARGD